MVFHIHNAILKIGIPRFYRIVSKMNRKIHRDTPMLREWTQVHLRQSMITIDAEVPKEVKLVVKYACQDIPELKWIFNQKNI